jgi:hypothetical protein
LPGRNGRLERIVLAVGAAFDRRLVAEQDLAFDRVDLELEDPGPAANERGEVRLQCRRARGSRTAVLEVTGRSVNERTSERSAATVDSTAVDVTCSPTTR